MNFFKIFNLYNIFFYNFNFLKFSFLNIFFNKLFFLNNYFLINELIWQEGLLIDFLQKKISDNWLKKFIIMSANLFNERLVFDKVIKFFLELIIWPMHKIFIFEFNNINGTIFINLFIFFFSFFFFIFFLLLMF